MQRGTGHVRAARQGAAGAGRAATRLRATSGRASAVQHDPMQQSRTVEPAAGRAPAGPRPGGRGGAHPLGCGEPGMAVAGKRRKALRCSALPRFWAWVWTGVGEAAGSAEPSWGGDVRQHDFGGEVGAWRARTARRAVRGRRAAGGLACAMGVAPDRWPRGGVSGQPGAALDLRPSVAGAGFPLEVMADPQHRRIAPGRADDLEAERQAARR